MAEGHEPVALRFRGPVVEARAAASRAAASGMSVTWLDGGDGVASFRAVVVDGASWSEAVQLVESLARPVGRRCSSPPRRHHRPSTVRCPRGITRRV